MIWIQSLKQIRLRLSRNCGTSFEPTESKSQFRDTKAMVINTGNSKPIAVRQPHYGLHETPIMQKTIDNLAKLNHSKPDTLSPWAFGITLATKPHQEDVTNIEKYVWRFCVNYIHLNMITCPAEYPIPRCDDAVMYGFGAANFFILLDAYSGYHQVRLSPASSIKTTFYTPHTAANIVVMMHDMQEKWEEFCALNGIDPSVNEGSIIIMDDTLLYAISSENAFTILRA
eukprot:scaffold190630_cov24-Attheya_sp.AAC.1